MIDGRFSDGKIKVHGTKEGDLYIKPSDLFAQKKVQELIAKISKRK